MKVIVILIDLGVEAQHGPPAIAPTFSTWWRFQQAGAGGSLLQVLCSWDEAGTCSAPSVVSTRGKLPRKALEATLVKPGWGQTPLWDHRVRAALAFHRFSPCSLRAHRCLCRPLSFHSLC